MSAVYAFAPGGYIAHIVSLSLPDGRLRSVCGKTFAGPGADDLPRIARVCRQCETLDAARNP